MSEIRDPAHSLVEIIHRPGASDGILKGLSFCVKDVYDIKGRTVGAGVLDWAPTHPPAREDSWAVRTALEAGASLIGVAKMTELSRGLTGVNLNYRELPLNTNAPGMVTGGSSSGPAAAVASRIADFAIATDTNGSSRAPASYCGIYGMRPSYGRVPVAGMMPHVPSFDAVGFFADSPRVLSRVAQAMIPGYRDASSSHVRIVIARDLFDLLRPAVKDQYIARLRELPVAKLVDSEVDLLSVTPERLHWAQLVVPGRENIRLYQDWFDSVDPRLSLGIARRIVRDSTYTDAEEMEARTVLETAYENLQTVLRSGTVALAPTTSTSAWEVGSTMSQIAESYYATGQLMGVATTGRLPQVSMPVFRVDGQPIGLSLIGARGDDETLVSLAQDQQLWTSS